VTRGPSSLPRRRDGTLKSARFTLDKVKKALRRVEAYLVEHSPDVPSLTRTSPTIVLKISVVPYDPTWPQAFQRIKLHLSTSLTEVPILNIEHVGSTAIPGLDAKPIIDIDIIVTPEYFPAAAATLSFGGYTYAPKKRGIDRMSFRYNAHTHDPGGRRPTEDGDIRRAVYLNMPKGVSLRNHLAVRSVLSGDKELVEEYSKVKMEVVKLEYKSIGYYGLAKNEIVRKILAKSDLAREELDKIADVNVMPPLTA